MKIIVYLGHPAHFHLYKNVIQNLKNDGHTVEVLIKKKENLEQLLQNSGIPYHNILREGRKDTKLGMAFGAIKRIWRELVFCIKEKPDLLTGTSVENSYVGPLLRIPVVYCGEDDADVIPLQAKICYPGASVVLTPDSCDDGQWNGKTTKYPSYHELAYLHPNHFKASKQIVKEQGINPDKPYAIMRFVKLKANHDDNIKGINKEVALRLIELMKPHLDIYITSERPLEPELEPYRIQINPIYMHDVMAFASLYIGDSQTMAAEAGVLGVPFVRFNDFVGRIGYLRELEDDYQLGIGIHASPLNDEENKNNKNTAYADINIDKKNTHSTPAMSDGPRDLERNHPQALTSELTAPVDASTPNLLPDEQHVECLQKCDVPSFENDKNNSTATCRNIPLSGTEALYEAVEKLMALSEEERKRIYGERVKKMLEEKIDYAKFLTWFIENYPASAESTRKADKAFWKQFK